MFTIFVSFIRGKGIVCTSSVRSLSGSLLGQTSAWPPGAQVRTILPLQRHSPGWSALSLLPGRWHPGPGDRNGPAPVGHRDHQQLMTKADFAAIHNQANLLLGLRLAVQPLLGDRFIPVPHRDCRVGQQAAQTTGHTHQFGLARDLPGHQAQIHRAALIDPQHQPDETANLSDPLAGSQFPDPLNKVLFLKCQVSSRF
jgi:hypothetical protein